MEVDPETQPHRVCSNTAFYMYMYIALVMQNIQVP